MHRGGVRAFDPREKFLDYREGGDFFFSRGGSRRHFGISKERGDE
jgi:hypothetical protein